MNTTLKVRFRIDAIPAIAVALLIGAAVCAHAADKKGASLPGSANSPVTSPGLPAAAPPPAIDPATGLPVAVPQWKDADWLEPDKTLPELVYDGIPLGEVAGDLRSR
jgi:hypothetical protein